MRRDDHHPPPTCTTHTHAPNRLTINHTSRPKQSAYRGDTAMHLVLAGRWPRMHALRLLLEFTGGDPRKRNFAGKSPLALAVEKGQAYLPAVAVLQVRVMYVWDSPPVAVGGHLHLFVNTIMKTGRHRRDRAHGHPRARPQPTPRDQQQQTDPYPRIRLIIDDAHAHALHLLFIFTRGPQQQQQEEQQ